MNPDLNINAKMKTSWQVKEVRHKRLHTELFQLYEIPELEKSTVTETRFIVTYDLG